MHEVDAYDVDEIMILKAGEAIRRRPGMYFGDVGSEGMTWALIGVIQDAMAASGGEVRVDVMRDRCARVDVSSGRPPGQAWAGRYGGAVYGLDASWWNPVVNTGVYEARHVCSSFELITRDTESRWMILFVDEVEPVARRIGATHREGFTMSMEFDPDAFDADASIDFGLLTSMLDEAALHHAGVRVRVFDERTMQEATFHWPEGLASALEASLPGASVFSTEVVDEEQGLAVRVAVAWGDSSQSWQIERALDPSGAHVPEGPHVDGVLGGVMESLCVLSRRLGDDTPLCWDARGALRGARVAIWLGRCPERWASPYTSWWWSRAREEAPSTERFYELAARAVAAELPAFLNRRPELRDELLRRVLV